MVELRKVDAKNIWEIVKLSVREDQMPFVASNTVSILEAYVSVTAGQVALPFGIYEGGLPVGFLMLSYDWRDEEEKPPAVSAGNYCIWRFMIDRHSQGRGLGRQALAAALDYMEESRPCGDAEACWLSYEPENTVARALYYAAGFRENGEKCGDETVAVRKFSKNRSV